MNGKFLYVIKSQIITRCGSGSMHLQWILWQRIFYHFSNFDLSSLVPHRYKNNDFVHLVTFIYIYFSVFFGRRTSWTRICWIFSTGLEWHRRSSRTVKRRPSSISSSRNMADLRQLRSSREQQVVAGHLHLLRLVQVCLGLCTIMLWKKFYLFVAGILYIKDEENFVLAGKYARKAFVKIIFV